jgi:hypothetical protein
VDVTPPPAPQHAREHPFQHGKVRRTHDRVDGPCHSETRSPAPPRDAAHAAAATLASTHHPAHALDRALGTARAAIGPAGHRADAGHRLGRGAREVHRHPGAGGEADDHDARIAHSALGLHAARDGQDLRGLAAGRRLLGGIEPVPAPIGVV